MFTRWLLIICLTLIPASGCSDTVRDNSDILHTLSTRAEALNSQNLGQYLSVVSPHYSDKGKNFTQLAESQKSNFKKFERISYEADRPTITVTGSSAVSVGSYRIKAVMQGKEVALAGTEQMRLVKEPGGWKIIEGI